MLKKLGDKHGNISNKAHFGGSEDSWGITINNALDTVVNAVNGISGTISPNFTSFQINGATVSADAMS